MPVPPELGRIELKAGQELAIPVTVEIPAKTPFDKHAFKVLVADDANAQEEFSQSPASSRSSASRRSKTPRFWKKVAIGAAAAGRHRGRGHPPLRTWHDAGKEVRSRESKM